MWFFFLLAHNKATTAAAESPTTFLCTFNLTFKRFKRTTYEQAGRQSSRIQFGFKQLSSSEGGSIAPFKKHSKLFLHLKNNRMFFDGTTAHTHTHILVKKKIISWDVKFFFNYLQCWNVVVVVGAVFCDFYSIGDFFALVNLTIKKIVHKFHLIIILSTHKSCCLLQLWGVSQFNHTTSLAWHEWT